MFLCGISACQGVKIKKSATASPGFKRISISRASTNCKPFFSSIFPDILWGSRKDCLVASCLLRVFARMEHFGDDLYESEQRIDPTHHSLLCMKCSYKYCTKFPFKYQCFQKKHTLIKREPSQKEKVLRRLPH